MGGKKQLEVPELCCLLIVLSDTVTVWAVPVQNMSLALGIGERTGVKD